MKKLNPNCKNGKFKLISKKEAAYVKGGTDSNVGSNIPLPPPYEPNGSSKDKKG